MSFVTLTFTIAGAAADALSDALLEAGALSVELTDADSGTVHEQAWFDTPGSSPARWRRARVGALFAADAPADAVLAAACAAVAVPLPAAIERAEVGDQDWVQLTRSQFRPIRISPELWIVPTWETAPDPRAINLSIDPGTAFGTGSHPTTRLCLRWLVAALRAGDHVLDYGCGSGILAIAAMRLGAAAAHGVDIDPQALLAARANAMQNGVAAEFSAPGGESESRYHVVVANILANPLIALAPLLARATRPQGRIALSGILASQADEVARTYARWYAMAAPVLDDGWALLSGERLEGVGP